MSANLTQFLDAYGLMAILAVMLLKEIGIPVPIPSDLIMLAAASQSAAGKFSVRMASCLNPAMPTSASTRRLR